MHNGEISELVERYRALVTPRGPRHNIVGNGLDRRLESSPCRTWQQVERLEGTGPEFGRRGLDLAEAVIAQWEHPCAQPIRPGERRYGGCGRRRWGSGTGRQRGTDRTRLSGRPDGGLVRDRRRRARCGRGLTIWGACGTEEQENADKQCPYLVNGTTEYE